MTFLNDALQKILDGTDPKEALEIKKNGGRKATLNSTEPYFQAAVRVEMLKADGMLWESAVLKEADEISKDFETVKKYHREYINKRADLSNGCAG